MEGMEGMKPWWKQVLMEIFPFFFFGGGRWGWKFLTDVESDPKMAGVSISKGYFVKVMEPPEMDARPTEELPAGVHT